VRASLWGSPWLPLGLRQAEGRQSGAHRLRPTSYPQDGGKEGEALRHRGWKTIGQDSLGTDSRCPAGHGGSKRGGTSPS